MKKMILLIIFLLLMMCTYSYKPEFLKIYGKSSLIFGSFEYSIYCLKVNEKIDNANVINLGNGFIVTTNNKNVASIKRKVSGILGESVKFLTTKNSINKIIKMYDITVFKEENIGEIATFYGYSANKNFSNNVLVDNKKINIQIAFNKNVMTIGTPLILGDY